MQIAILCQLDADRYYPVTEALLSDQMRDTWLRYLRVEPQQAAWTGLDTYMGIHYAALDKTAEAKKKIEKNRLQHDTEKAWQVYANQQMAYVTEMGNPTERSKTDRWLCIMFLANISALPDVHTAASKAYMREAEEYSKLPIQGKSPS